MREIDWKLKISEAVGELAQLKFFPSDELARAGIMKLLLRLVEFGRVDQLEWLVRAMVDTVGTWNGPLELRGVFCTRFKPADGTEADCALTPGFSPEAMEARSATQHIPALPAPQARALLAGVVKAEDGEDVESIIARIAKMPGPMPNARDRRTPTRTNRERDQVAESVKDQLQPERRRPLTPEGRARLAAFYASQVKELGAAELEAPEQEATRTNTAS